MCKLYHWAGAVLAAHQIPTEDDHLLYLSVLCQGLTKIFNITSTIIPIYSSLLLPSATLLQPYLSRGGVKGISRFFLSCIAGIAITTIPDSSSTW